MSIFICRGICVDCGENKCPFRYDLEFKEVLAHNQVLELIKNEILSPDSLIDLMEDNSHSLFNSINSWSLKGMHISKKDIKRCILEWLPVDIADDMSSEIYEIFQNSVMEITQKIYDALNDDCIMGKCFSCIIKEYCPNVQGNIAKAT